MSYYIVLYYDLYTYKLGENDGAGKWKLIFRLRSVRSQISWDHLMFIRTVIERRVGRNTRWIGKIRSKTILYKRTISTRGNRNHRPITVVCVGSRRAALFSCYSHHNHIIIDIDRVKLIFFRYPQCMFVDKEK